MWHRVPDEVGLDATGILKAASEGRIDTLVLLGADPLGDHPDRSLAAAALAGARRVVSVDLFLTDSTARADVVLPAAGPNEVEGTHTNVEGRVSVLGRAVTPPGTARPAWIVAADLAMRLGADLGLESTADIWAEIASVAPSHAGITADLLEATGDGVVVPLGAAPLTTTWVDQAGEALADGPDPEGAAPDTDLDADETEAPEPSGEEAAGGGSDDTDPADAEDGPDSDAESDPDGDDDGDDAVVEDSEDDAAVPAGITFSAPAPTVVPPVDAYTLRLVIGRTLYDDGTLTQASRSLAHLPADAPLRVHPTVLDRLGVTEGTRVRAISPRATVTVPVVADAGVPRGVAAVSLRRVDGVRDLVDVDTPLTEVRVETT